MKTTAINTPRKARIRRHLITDISRTMKALRLLKGLTRKEAGALCGVSARAFEQLENGRCFMKPGRIERYANALGYTMEDYEKNRINAREILHELKKIALEKRPRVPPKPRRNTYKKIIKEVRVIRILRKRMGLTQYQAAHLCGYATSIFGQIENGRIELPRPRIEHIVRRLGLPVLEFDKLMKMEVLRDEMIEQCAAFLDSLEDHKLESAQTVIKALMR